MHDLDNITSGLWPGDSQVRELLLQIHEDDELLDGLCARAGRVARDIFSNKVLLRGLVEIGNVCRNDCYYCGIRRSNANVCRYELSPQEILDTCRGGYSMGFRTFVLQGGENPRFTDDMLCGLLRDIKTEMPDCAVTLSLGERGRASFKRLYDAGADRYLLRHEAVNEDLFYKLHPRPSSEDPQALYATTGHAKRLSMLEDLRSIGYQTGTGFMVGPPGQTVDDLVADLRYIFDFKPQMIGIGPYLPHPDTPFGPAEDPYWTPLRKYRTTLACVALVRLMFPKALIPATTALNTIIPDGRYSGILAGANVVMPNISPADARQAYSLYSGKVTDGGDSRSSLDGLLRGLASIGYVADWSRGDYKG